MARRSKGKSKMEQENKDQVVDQETVENTAENTENVEETKEETPAEPTAEERISELEDKQLRLFAEFENFKRRTAKERVDLIKNASERLLTELLTVLDDFDRAVKAGENETDVEKMKEGLSLIQQKFTGILAKEGLKEMEPSIGEPLDTDKHEAITKIPAPTEELKGKIVDEVEKGYTLNDKVIRFAKVVVGQSE